MVTTLNEVPRLLTESPTGTAQLEWPQKVVSLLEMRAHCVNLVDQIFHADQALLPKHLNKELDNNDRLSVSLSLSDKMGDTFAVLMLMLRILTQCPSIPKLARHENSFVDGGPWASLSSENRSRQPLVFWLYLEGQKCPVKTNLM
jgi:hypothetical protein